MNSVWRRNLVGDSYHYGDGLTIQWQIFYGCLMVVSQLFAMLIPISYLYSKKCRHHPASIILILCILEMVYTHQIFCLRVLNTQIDYDNILIYFLSFYFNYQYPLSDMGFRAYQIYVICIIAEICYFIVLSIDLIVTLKKPFINSSSKISLYHKIAILSTIVIFTLNFFIFATYETNNTKNFFVPGKNDLVVILGLMGVLFVVNLITFYCGWASLRQMKKMNSKSQEIKKKYIKNNMIMNFVIFFWVPVNFGETFIALQDLYGVSVLGQLDPFLILQLTSPTIFALLRFRDPYFLFRIKFILKKITRIKISLIDKNMVKAIEKSDDKDQDDWLTPLSQLFKNHQNNENVTHILASILKVVDYKQETDFDLSLQELKLQAKFKITAELAQNKKNHANEYSINSGQDTEIPLLEDQNIFCDYKIIEYAPRIYQRLREIDGITKDQFRQSLDLQLNRIQITKSQESLGRSGSFFFFSHDQRLILKTLKYEELQTLIDILLPSYFSYLSENKQTLIAKIYGAFTVNIENLSSVHLILMENTSKYIPSFNLRLYDIKGSIVGRQVNKIVKRKNSARDSFLQEEMLQQILKDGESVSPFEVLKDVNFMESRDLFLELDPQIRKELLKVLQADSNLLKSLNIMDYSLFLCIANLREGDIIERDQNNQFRSIIQNGQIISISVIDILQIFNMNKWIEKQFKSLNSDKPNMISCIDAEHYSQRFLNFINSFCLPSKEYN